MIQIRISEPIREYSDHNMSKEPTNPPWERIRQLIWCITCKQAVRGALAVGQEKEGELAITSLEFEYLHRKIDAKCWLAEMTLVMMSLPLARAFSCFSMFVYICALSHFALIGGIWQTSPTGSHRGIGERVERVSSYKLFFLFPPRRQSAPESLLAGQGLFS